MITATLIVMGIWLLIVTIALGSVITDQADTRDQLQRSVDVIHRVMDSLRNEINIIKHKRKDDAI